MLIMHPRPRTGRQAAPEAASPAAECAAAGAMHGRFSLTSRLLLAALLVSAACAAREPLESGAGAGAGGATPAAMLEKRVVGSNAVATSAHPLASEAGIEILRRGGNAVDAAVAIGFALNVVEPMMSGVGGGGGMLIWLQQEGRAEYVDFYSAARSTSYQRPLPDTGRASLRSVGVPGAAAGFVEAHERYGRLPLGDVIAPAIRLAEDGFPVYLVLHDAILANRAKLARFPEAARRFLPGGEPLPIGETLRQPELGRTLRRIAERGRAGFYDGPTAQSLVDVLNAGGNPTSLDDLAAYRPQWEKRPLCTTYRGRVVLSAPPPQTGMRVLHALNLLERHDLRALGLPTRSAEALHLLASALRVAHIDHTVHNDDPNWSVVPAAGVTAKSFARSRADLVDASPVPERLAPGHAADHDGQPPAAACVPHEPYGPARRTGAGDGLRQGGLRAPARGAAQGDVAAPTVPPPKERPHTCPSSTRKGMLWRCRIPCRHSSASARGWKDSFSTVHPSPSSSACNRNRGSRSGVSDPRPSRRRSCSRMAGSEP
jgi:hypothetical protein